jgi:hypothetical protein
MMYRIARPALRKAMATPSIRTYVAPINDLNFLIKDVFKFSEHYKKLGFDAEVELSQSSRRPKELTPFSLSGMWR